MIYDDFFFLLINMFSNFISFLFLFFFQFYFYLIFIFFKPKIVENGGRKKATTGSFLKWLS